MEIRKCKTEIHRKIIVQGETFSRRIAQKAKSIIAKPEHSLCKESVSLPFLSDTGCNKLGAHSWALCLKVWESLMSSVVSYCVYVLWIFVFMLPLCKTNFLLWGDDKLNWTYMCGCASWFSLSHFPLLWMALDQINKKNNNNMRCHILPVKPENLRGAFTDGSAGGAISWPVVFNLACTFFFGLALTFAIRSTRQDEWL